MKTKALLYTDRTCSPSKSIVTFELLKNDFSPDNYKKTSRTRFSDALGVEITDTLLLIEGHEVFALFFSDGSIWDTSCEWRPYNDKEQILKTFKAENVQPS